MVTYNFKAIGSVPEGKDFVDIVLSGLQRRTPTVVHPGYHISRIRNFYTRKVKFCQQTVHDKLAAIIEEFPRFDDIHPFYSDLANVLYDKDHYKLALGQIAMARTLVDKVAKDYVRLLKFGDTLYRCKQLKRAAVGRIATILRRQGPSLAYLEQVRQHLARLPSIDPNARTLLVCGYPNVGKSSFVNNVTHADVEVQPYAFTTRALYIGHTDYKYLRWQVIDTPGILDRPLEQMNTIEMQSVTALAHIRATVLYFLDISETCGYNIPAQMELFNSIRPLMREKPVLLVCTKTDLQPFEGLPQETQTMLKELCEREGIELAMMSNASEEGVIGVKTLACDKLLHHRAELKINGSRLKDVLNRIHVAMPRRSAPGRTTSIPEGARVPGPMEDRPAAEADIDDTADFRQRYILGDEDWKADTMVEIMDGHNVADFVDPDILAKLDELDEEEEANAVAGRGRAKMRASMAHADEARKAEVASIRARQRLAVAKAKFKTAHTRKQLINKENTLNRFETHLELMGMDPSKARERLQDNRGRSRSLSRSRSRAVGGVAGERGSGTHEESLARSRSLSRRRGVSAVVTAAVPGRGFRDTDQKSKAAGMVRKALVHRGKMSHTARKGEADRHIPDFKPKHLNTGKRGIGKTDRR